MNRAVECFSACGVSSNRGRYMYTFHSSWILKLNLVVHSLQGCVLSALSCFCEKVGGCFFGIHHCHVLFDVEQTLGRVSPML